MAGDTLTVGNVEIVVLTDAEVDFSIPLSQLHPGMTPERWEPYRRRYPEVFAGPDTWRLHFGGHLIRSRGRTLLVDTGTGPTTRPLLNNPPGRLLEELGAGGVRAEDVDRVFFTHLHPDHVGWSLTAQGRPVFPRARYTVHRADWETFQRPEVQQAFPFTYVDETLTPLAGLGVLDLLEGEHALTEEVTALEAPGHTPGHMAVLIISAGERALILGDALVNPAQVTEPEMRFAFDSDGETAAATRRRLLDRIEAEGMKVAQCHFPAPGFGRIVRLEGRRYWQGL